MKIINLTPHQINVVKPDGTLIASFPPSGQVARVTAKVTPAGAVDNIPLFKIMFGDPVDLPAPTPGTLFVVSSLVFSATDRKDVIAPNTNDAIRDDKGNIIGVPGFLTKKF